MQKCAYVHVERGVTSCNTHRQGSTIEGVFLLNLTRKHMSTRPDMLFCMTFAHPSAIWARAIRAACRCFQSGEAMSCTNRLEAMGATVFPPSDSASLSRHSWPNSYSSPPPAASCLSESPRCHSFTSCRSDISVDLIRLYKGLRQQVYTRSASHV